MRYADYAAWQRRWLVGDVLDAQLAYWRERLAGAPVLALPADRPRRGSRAGATLRRPWPAARADALKELARRTGSTLFMTLLTAFAALLSRLSGQRDLAVGTPIAGRRHSEVEGLMGLFLNTLALRLDVKGSGRELLGQARKRTLEAYSHQDLPFEKLVEELAPERLPGTPPLFQAVLILQNLPGESPSLDEATLRPLPFETRSAKLDLTLTAAERPDGALGLGFNYRTELFDATTVRRWASHLEVLVDALAEAPERAVDKLDVLRPAERHQLTREWSATAHVARQGAPARTPRRPGTAHARTSGAGLRQAPPELRRARRSVGTAGALARPPARPTPSRS